MKLSKIKMLIASTLFLSLCSCASKPKAKTFDGEWKFGSVTGENEPRACLKEADVIKLREVLIRCEGTK